MTPQAGLAAGNYTRALSSATRGLERAPAAERLHYAKCRALLALDRPGEAVRTTPNGPRPADSAQRQRQRTALNGHRPADSAYVAADVAARCSALRAGP